MNEFWQHIEKINRDISIFHQWDELEKSGCIDNFRILIGEKVGFREGWVFADSDAYKWLDAASRIYAQNKDPNLKALIDDLLRLIWKTMESDGYIYTYNQFHFPGQRWVNLQIEHELYCLGHLIEGCVSHFKTFADSTVINRAEMVGDLVYEHFLNKPSIFTDGHEEIEIALIKLSEITQNKKYIELAQQLIDRRGKDKLFGLKAHFQKNNSQARRKAVQKQRAEFKYDHPDFIFTPLPPDNESINAPFSALKRKLEELSGVYFQQNLPVAKQFSPVGHSVRFGYLQTAATRLLSYHPNSTTFSAIELSWQRMVNRRMYVTGGIGSFSWNEGFGKDYDLDPALAYNETCAGIASILWSFELGELTTDPKYFDLVEWQFYNAVLVGLGIKGNNYLYNNPLSVQIDIQRRNWFSVPCCPPNLSRLLCEIPDHDFFIQDHSVYINGYIPTGSNDREISIQSDFPFGGNITICINKQEPINKLFLRVPSWCRINSDDFGGYRFTLNGEQMCVPVEVVDHERPASDFDPTQSRYFEVPESSITDTLHVSFETIVNIHQPHPKLSGHSGKIAISRGPLVYCLESVDNETVDIFTTAIDPGSIHEYKCDLFGFETILLQAYSTTGETLTLIPYFLWGNRGRSKMVVWINSTQPKGN